MVETLPWDWEQLVDKGELLSELMRMSLDSMQVSIIGRPPDQSGMDGGSDSPPGGS